MPKDQAKQQQPSRKGKATWRKNIDLAPVEERLEIQRQAESLGLAGGVGQAGDLFVEDRKGDEALLARQRKNRRGLKSLEVLNRDAVGVPAVLSRKEKGSLGGKTPEERSGMSAKQIAKLRRMTGRQTGPFGAVVEQSQEDKEEQRAKADIKVAEYDVWGAESPRVHVKPLKHDVEKRRLPDVPLPLPDPGQSYNPPAEAHDALLEKAMKVAEDEENERLKHREWKRKWDAGGEYARQEEEEGKNVMGMRVDGEDDDDKEPDDEQAEVEALTTRKEPKRKTKAQRARSLKHKEAERQRLLQKSIKSTHQAIQSLPSLKKSLAKAAEEKQEAAQQRREAKLKRLERRVGRFELPKEEHEVQLGEELSEGLRGLKPEGNLIRDRIHHFAKRGLVEPRAPSTKEPRRAATKTYETHAYKRFH